MSEKDVLITASSMRVTDNTAISAKPAYLVSLTEKESQGVGKKAQAKRFIALDLPTMQPAFIQTKGFYTDADEATILVNFRQMQQEVNKEAIMEVYFPWHSVHSIRSLVFKSK